VKQIEGDPFGAASFVPTDVGSEDYTQQQYGEGLGEEGGTLADEQQEGFPGDGNPRDESDSSEGESDGDEGEEEETGEKAQDEGPAPADSSEGGAEGKETAEGEEKPQSEATPAQKDKPKVVRENPSNLIFGIWKWC